MLQGIPKKLYRDTIVEPFVTVCLLEMPQERICKGFILADQHQPASFSRYDRQSPYRSLRFPVCLTETALTIEPGTIDSLKDNIYPHILQQADGNFIRRPVILSSPNCT